MVLVSWKNRRNAWGVKEGCLVTDKELQKLRRADLIELLYYLSRENDALKEENEKLTARLDALVGEAIAAKQQTAGMSAPESSDNESDAV